ncbi:MAG: autotransporter domain-containing protein, partial [Planctomycetia bacterium]|nr:autotransporter domain-containing protein [Planctomycetia bacterium]
MKVVSSMEMKKVQKILSRNRILFFGFLFLILSLPGNAGFGAVQTLSVSDAAGLRAALNTFNSSSDSVVINLSGTVILSGDLPVIHGNGENTLTIKGGVIDGADNYRGLFIDSEKTDGTGTSKITVDGTTFQNCRALGGSGGSGAVGGGGGMGAGGAIYAKSGEIVLKDVVYTGNIAQGGAGGNVLYQSNTNGGGGGLGGNGAGGTVGDALTNTGSGGNGGSVGRGNNGVSSANNAGSGGGYVYTATADKNQNPHYEGSTALVGGDGGYGGGGGGSIDIGGGGGLGGGGGAGADLGGSGGFGGGGAGGSSASTAGVGGYGAGNGGYVADVPSSNGHDATPGGGTGGGGAGLGGALYIEKGANVSFEYSTSKEMSGNTAVGGTAGTVSGLGSGTATAGSGIGSGAFLKDKLAINVAEGATYTVNNVLAGDTSAEDRDAGIEKTGKGTLVLKYASSYYGDTTISDGILNADARGAISPYSVLNIEGGTVNLGADQSVLDLQGGSAGILNLGGKTLNITYGGLAGSTGEYAGVIKSNGDAGTGGNLAKSGIGTLHLTGDSSAYNFTTTLNGGSIQIGNAGALGSGKIIYARTDTTDISKALIFDNSMVLNNKIEMNGNKDMMRLGTASGSPASMRVELAGQITASNSDYGTILLDASDPSQIFRFSNTGVDAGVHTAANDNTFSTIDIKKGTLEVVSEKVAGTGEDIYYSGLGSASVNNNGANSFKLISSEDDVYLKNDFTFESGLLTFENERAGQDYHLSGKMSGNGGLALDMKDENDVLYLTGKLTYEGPTRILNGVLDVSGAKTSSYTSGGVQKDYVYLIGLETTADTDSAKVITGTKDLYLGGIADYSYKGIITDGISGGSGANIYKTSAGQLDLSLESGSNVQLITVQNGTLNLIDDTLKAIPITLTNTGVLGIKTDITLDNLDPSVKGTGIKVYDGYALTLEGVANKQNIAANLSGEGTLNLAARSDGNDWTLSGTNSDWNGTLTTTSGSNLILASATGAGGEDAEIQLGSGASITSSINADIPNLIMDGSAKLKVASGKTLTISGLADSGVPGSQLTIEGLTAADGTIQNGGTVVLNKNAASGFYGATNVNRSVLKILGDNTTNPLGGTRGETSLNGGTIVLDYSDSTLADGETAFGNIWGNEDIQIKGLGGGIDVQGNNKTVVLSNDIIFNGGSTDSEGKEIVPQAVFTVRDGDVVYKGEFSGDTGDLYKFGTGTLILDGSGNITGKTTVNAGTLQLGGTAATPNTQLANSDLIVNPSGMLTGWGSEFKSMILLGNMNLSSDTINFNTGTGNNAFTMYSGSLIEAEMLDADHYTRITADNGNMVLKGGTINVVVDENYLDQIVSGTTLEMFETVNGTLSAKTSNLILLDNVIGKRLVAEKDGNNKLNLVFRDMDYAAYATTENTRSVAQTLNRISDLGGGVYPQISEQLENAVSRNSNFLQELTGELNMSGFNAQISTRNLLRQTISNTLYPTSDSQIFCSRSSIYRGQITEPDHALSGWGNVFGSLGDAKENDGLAGYDYEMMGGVFGLELGSTDTAQAGIFYSYIHSKLGTDSNIGSLKLDENIFGGYFRWDDALGYGLLLGSANSTNYTGSRSIYISNAENGTFKSDRDGTGFSIYGERGCTFNTGWSRIQPYIGLQYINLQQDGFEETGGNTLSLYRLKMDDSEFNSFQSVLGIRANLDGCVNNRPIRGFVYANWIHEFSDTQGEGIASFSAAQGQLPSFRVVGNDLGCNWILGGFGG